MADRQELTASSARTPTRPGTSPTTATENANSKLSANNRRTMRRRLAPIAARIANSRLRPAVRTSSRLAMLAQAIGKAKLTAPSRIRSDLRVPAMI